MKPTIKVSAWESLLLNFSDVFTKPTAGIFSNFLTAWVLATGRRTVCGIFWFVRDRQLRAHDAYHRFFSRASWKTEDLWQTWAVWVVNHLTKDGVIHLILDDTVYHRTGRKVNGAGWWRDAVRSTATHVVHAWGLNLVVLAIRVDPRWGGEPIAIPVHLKVHRKGGPSLMELAIAAVNEMTRWCPLRRFSLAADGFYASLAGKGLPVRFISRMRRDAAVFDLPPARRPHQRGATRKKGARLPTPEKMARRVRSWRHATVMERGKPRERLLCEQILIWYKVSHAPVKLVVPCSSSSGQTEVGQ
ncbi:MAG: transposase [Planctomycetota bacterium]